MSNTFANVPLGKQVREMDVSPQFDVYSGVEIIVDDDTSVFAGNRSGRVLQIENAWGTQAQANAILSSLTATGFQYQPYTATGAILNPAAEIGDGVTLNGVYSGIYEMSKAFGSMMFCDIEAPQDEQIDHEYPFETKQDRTYRREIAEASAKISINEGAITAEVLRATNAENSLSSQIVQTANGITASVLSKTGGSSQSFGWNLTDTSWELKSNNSTVLKATASGIEINGKVTATSGFIGNGSNGFTISSTSIYNGMNNINSGSSGIYIGTNGIALGGGAFKVTSGGSVSANNMVLTGTLTIGGQTISAAALRSGAQSAYNNGSYWSGGAAGGYGFSNATTSQNYAPNYLYVKTLSATSVVASSSMSTPSMTVGGFPLKRKLVTVKDGSGNNMSLSLWVYA